MLRRQLLLLFTFAGLSSPAFAQVSSTCGPTTPTASGTPLNLYLNATVRIDGTCEYSNSSTPLAPGAIVPGCYSGTEQSSGYTLNAQTSCIVCTGGPGCFVFLPPPNPITPVTDPSLLPPLPTFPAPTGPIVPDIGPPPPPIGAYYWDPSDPWNPYPNDPWYWWWWHGCL